MKIVDYKDKINFPNNRVEQFRNFNIDEVLNKNFIMDGKCDLNRENFKVFNDDFDVIFIDDNIENNRFDGVEVSYSKKRIDNYNNPLFALNKEINDKEIYIKISKDLIKPLVLFNIYKGENRFINSTINIDLEKGVKAYILDYFSSNRLNDSHLNINREISLKGESNLNYVKVQNIENSNSIITNYEINLEEQSTINLFPFDYGGEKSINQFYADLNSKEVNLNIDGIVKIGGVQKSGNIAHINHIKNNSYSDINFNHIIKDKAHAIFDIGAEVRKTAINSKVFQSSKTILLDKRARVNAIPRLKVFIDQLEAKHGATTGSIDKDELFYLESRGINKKLAKKIIIKSIENAVIDKIENKTINEWIKSLRGVYDV